MGRKIEQWALLIGVIVLLAGCKNRPRSLKLDPATEARAQAWKSDRMGCDGVRTDEMGAALAQAFQGTQVSPDGIEDRLGEPEFTQVRNGFKVYGYYYWAECVDGTIPDGTVYCVLEFFFESDSGRLKEAGVVCG